MDDRPLTEEERRILAELELDLMRGRTAPARRRRTGRRVRPRAAWWWVVLTVTGAVTIGAGLVSGWVPLALAGYVILLVGVVAGTYRPGARRLVGRVSAALGIRREPHDG